MFIYVEHKVIEIYVDIQVISRFVVCSGACRKIKSLSKKKKCRKIKKIVVYITEIYLLFLSPI